MQPYLIIAKFPKNPTRFIKNFKDYMLNECYARDMDCVIERVQGRIVVHASENPCKIALEFKGIKRCMPVRIFESREALVKYVLDRVAGAESFAVRSNHLSVAREIGEILYEATHTPVSLENPALLIEVEYRDEMYFLFEE